MSSVARVKFIKTTVIFRYHTKGLSNQVSSYSDYEIKSYSCSNSSTKVGMKTKKSGKFSGLQNGAMRRLQIGLDFRDYKSGQEGLHIGATLENSNRGKEITNWGRDFKSGRRL